MTEDQKKKLEQKLWDIANTLRGKMNADEFRDYILGFIFFKYLSERMYLYANDVLKQDGIDQPYRENATTGCATFWGIHYPCGDFGCACARLPRLC